MSTGGRVHHGAAAQAGEIGHLPTGLDGPLCGCGRRACLSQFTDAASMLDAAERQGLLGTADGRSMTARLGDLAGAARGGEAGAVELLDGFGTALGELRTLIGVHDPHRVVIGGPSWFSLAPLRSAGRAACAEERPMR